MRASSGYLWDLWTAGGPFIGADRSHGRVTVETGYALQTYSSPLTGWSDAKLPVRWFQRQANDQVETEIPNVLNIHAEWSLDNDAATCQITILNQKMTFVASEGSPAFQELGQPGYFTPFRGTSSTAVSRWGQSTNAWEDVLVENALIRTYQGYGGYNSDGTPKTISAAKAAGNLWLTGTWLVDDVRVQTDGTLVLRCRSMAALLLDQPVTDDLIPTGPNYPTDLTTSIYPLRYSRYFDRWIESAGALYGVIEGNTRWVVGMGAGAYQGYWIAGSDGGVFTYGPNFFYGSMGGSSLSAAIVGMAVTPTAGGYYLVAADGGVFAFGDAVFLGHPSSLAAPATEIEAHPTGTGYYLVAQDGGVFAYGSAGFHGNALGLSSHPIVDISIRPQGDGYWLVSDHGEVYAFGGATYHGGSPTLSGGELVTGMEVDVSGNGYWLTSTIGSVFAYGDAVFYGSAAALTLNDPVTDIVRSQTGSGYWLIAMDGGVFSYGDAPFLGSLPGTTLLDFPVDGNYADFADIIKDLLMWSGFWLENGSSAATVYGNLETTGVFATVPIPQEIFDKRPVMDGITQIKEIVAYQFWVDEEGAVRFESPNWFTRGNYLNRSGTHTTTVPVVDERLQLTSYGVQTTNSALRSAIKILVDNTTTGQQELTVYTPPDSGALKGKQSAAQFYVPVYLDSGQRTAMAKGVAMHIWFQQRVGAVTAAANPLIQLGDQVIIYERQTAETYYHYVRGITFDHDIQAGTYTMTLQTHWLGDASSWAADMFS